MHTTSYTLIQTLVAETDTIICKHTNTHARQICTSTEIKNVCIQIHTFRNTHTHAHTHTHTYFTNAHKLIDPVTHTLGTH